jgi:hypothetical protein
VLKNITTTLRWSDLELPPINLYNAPYHKSNEKHRTLCAPDKKDKKKINSNINHLYEKRKIN